MDARHHLALLFVREEFRAVVVEQNDIHLLGTIALLGWAESNSVAGRHTLSIGVQREQRQQNTQIIHVGKHFGDTRHHDMHLCHRSGFQDIAFIFGEYNAACVGKQKVGSSYANRHIFAFHRHLMPHKIDHLLGRTIGFQLEFFCQDGVVFLLGKMNRRRKRVIGLLLGRMQHETRHFGFHYADILALQKSIQLDFVQNGGMRTQNGIGSLFANQVKNHGEGIVGIACPKHLAAIFGEVCFKVDQKFFQVQHRLVAQGVGALFFKVKVTVIHLAFGEILLVTTCAIVDFLPVFLIEGNLAAFLEYRFWFTHHHDFQRVQFFLLFSRGDRPQNRCSEKLAPSPKPIHWK